MTTSKPASANATAVARPIPVAAPVIKATRRFCVINSPARKWVVYGRFALASALARIPLGFEIATGLDFDCRGGGGFSHHKGKYMNSYTLEHVQLYCQVPRSVGLFPPSQTCQNRYHRACEITVS